MKHLSRKLLPPIFFTAIIFCLALSWSPSEVYAAVTFSRTADPAGVDAVSTVATYSTVSIGAAVADRIVVVVVGTELVNSTPSAATIDSGSGAVAMTAATGGSFGALRSQIFYLPVPTGITATITVTFSNTSPTATANHIAVYKITGAGTVLSAEGSDGSSDMDGNDPLTTGSVTIPVGGGFLAIAAGAIDTAAKTWANAVEDLDVDAGGFRFTTAASTSAGTATVTVTGVSNGEDGALSYVIFKVPAAPTVTTQDVSGVGAASATFHGDITATGGADVTVRGFAWGTLSNLSGGDTATTTDTVGQPFGTGAFTESGQTLVCNTTYYYRPYATNSVGTGYGTVSNSFTTGPCASAPTVETNPASSITARAATLNGTISATGGENATARGFAWGTNSALSGGDTSTTTESGSFGAGTFSRAVSNILSGRTYYFRAYATNPTGTGYGNITSFSTLSSSGVRSSLLRLFKGYKMKLVGNKMRILQK